MPFGTDDASSALVVVLDDAVKSGDDTPDEPLGVLLSDLVRSTAMSLAGCGLLCSGTVFLDSTAVLSSEVASTSSAQLLLGPSSENVPIAGVAVPEFTLLEEVCDAGVVF